MVTITETNLQVAEDLYIPESLINLRRDLRKNASKLSAQEIRYIIDTYYTVQDYRISINNQMRSLSKAEEPIGLLEWIESSIGQLEKEIQKWMQGYAESRPTGEWALSICGIGPVLAAGFLAYLEQSNSTNISQWWAFAGLDPTKEWSKRQKRPWAARLKVLAYKAGESFVKVQNRDNDFYGKLYRERKDLETLRNEQGFFKDTAARILSVKNYSKDTDAYAAYSKGKLPKAHIHARARRHAVKIFLCHIWQVFYEEKHGTSAPDPWILTPMGGHTDRIAIPQHTCEYKHL